MKYKLKESKELDETTSESNAGDVMPFHRLRRQTPADASVHPLLPAMQHIVSLVVFCIYFEMYFTVYR